MGIMLTDKHNNKLNSADDIDTKNKSLFRDNIYNS
jgi:hypothetical protein